MSASSEFHLKRTIDNAEWLQARLDTVMAGLAHIIAQSEDSTMMADFLQRQLIEYSGRIAQLKTHAENLEALAANRAPDELPF